MFSRTCRNLILKPKNPIKHDRNVFPLASSFWHCLAARSGITHPKTPVLPYLAQGRAFPAIPTGICHSFHWKISAQPFLLSSGGIRNISKVQGNRNSSPLGSAPHKQSQRSGTTSMAISQGKTQSHRGQSREEFAPPSPGEQHQQEWGKENGNGNGE